jgi:predicted nucleotidyltransferase
MQNIRNINYDAIRLASVARVDNGLASNEDLSTINVLPQNGKIDLAMPGYSVQVNHGTIQATEAHVYSTGIQSVH